MFLKRNRGWRLFWQRLRLLDRDESGATVEWLLVSGVVVLTVNALSIAIITMIKYIFYRTALVIALPFG